MEHPGFNPVPVWDADLGGGGFTHYTTMLVPVRGASTVNSQFGRENPCLLRSSMDIGEKLEESCHSVISSFSFAVFIMFCFQ